ncbi:MAG TPA: PsiF family protein [Rhodocyclaceae bacterium]|nr:PsiF family protein [Rhodocyclaceae bacterium]
MKRTVLAAAVSLLFANLALAPSASAGTQQDKMTACNKEAGDKKLSGDERKKFMSECLSSKPAGEKAATEKAAGEKAAADKPAATSQQEKMKACNKEAGDKKLSGDERKKFMSECLKG